MRFRTSLVVALAAALLPACKDSTGPSVTFPTLPAQLLANFCVRGERVPGQAIGGSVSTSDCPLGDGSFFETWRVRVATAGNYQFAASSAFDNLLSVLRVDSFTTTTASVTQIAFDDDGGTGNNALIAGAPLVPNVDYILAVNGYLATDTGPYTVTFTKNAVTSQVAAPLTGTQTAAAIPFAAKPRK